MRELSLHILDIVKNSTRAGASLVEIELDIQREKDTISFTVRDNGCGMNEELLNKVLDPFTTTRTTRKVGLGLPLLKMAAEAAGGGLTIRSEVGKGTDLTAVFGLSHIDRMPLGDFAGSVVTLISGDPKVRFVVTVRAGAKSFTLDTEEVKAVMEGIPITAPEVLEFIKSFLEENLSSIYGGNL